MIVILGSLWSQFYAQKGEFKRGRKLEGALIEHTRFESIPPDVFPFTNLC